MEEPIKRIPCDLPGHADEWFEHKRRISIGKFKEWIEADVQKTETMLLEFIADSNLTGADGQLAPKPREPGAMDALELKMPNWLVRAITRSYIDEKALPPEA